MLNIGISMKDSNKANIEKLICILSHHVAFGSDITLFNKIDKPPVVYII